ncbi:MAG: OB-fold domain-containing protein [Deltaproteobacteria bacterium]|nr:OB-fold domain-containing protein [Deltaproteobacteria bacterium]
MPKPELDTRFSKFGTVSFTATTKVNDFIAYLEKGQVAGTVCRKCGQKFFPPRAHCYACLDAEMDWFTVEGAGKLLTYSILRYAPIGFGDDLPYAICVVDYGDYKVFGRIGDVPFEELSHGMALKARVNTLANGQLNYVFDRA